MHVRSSQLSAVNGENFRQMLWLVVDVEGGRWLWLENMSGYKQFLDIFYAFGSCYESSLVFYWV